MDEISRRKVAAGLAWTVPAVVLSTAVPAYALSPTSGSISGALACKDAGNGQFCQGYAISLTFSYAGPKPVTLRVTNIAGAGLTPDDNFPYTTPVTMTTSPQTFVFHVCSTNSGTFVTITVSYSLNGVVQTPVTRTLRAPNC